LFQQQHWADGCEETGVGVPVNEIIRENFRSPDQLCRLGKSERPIRNDAPAVQMISKLMPAASMRPTDSKNIQRLKQCPRRLRIRDEFDNAIQSLELLKDWDASNDRVAMTSTPENSMLDNVSGRLASFGLQGGPAIRTVQRR
jgi:hypothetical protein